jgi:hypothetical protein
MSILGEERLREKIILGILREVAANGYGVWRVEEMKERRKKEDFMKKEASKVEIFWNRDTCDNMNVEKADERRRLSQNADERSVQVMSY